MKITAALRAYLVQRGWAGADASDDKVRQVVTAKLTTGDLAADKLAELSKETPAPGASTLATLVDQAVAKRLNLAPKPAADPLVANLETAAKKINGQSPSDLLAEAAPTLEPEIRVRSAIEQYEHTRKTAVCPTKTMKGTHHPFAGQPAVHMGRTLDLPSARDKAIAGAYFKWCLSLGTQPRDIPRGLRLTDHDRDLVEWAKHNSSWTGVLNSSDDGYHWRHDVNRRRLNEFEKAALLDDSTSGGIEIAPIEFDDMLVTTPVLFGELFPLVNVVTVARGRRMKGGAIGNPTITSGTAEGSSITVFDATSLVSAFDTTIYNAVGAMEIGMDFEEDSPTNVGEIIMQKYGEKYMEWLDEQIAIGDGTTEPQGISNLSSVTVVPSDNGTGGPPTVSDYEGLMFGVSKAFRNTKGGRNVFIGNDTSYSRARGIAVSGTDERRVFGMNQMDYKLLGFDYKIQNSIGNSTIMFGNLGYYRMYRRLGVTVRVETQGQTLALKNTRLIVVRARFGGKGELAGAFAVTTDAQS